LAYAIAVSTPLLDGGSYCGGASAAALRVPGAVTRLFAPPPRPRPSRASNPTAYLRGSKYRSITPMPSFGYNVQLPSQISLHNNPGLGIFQKAIFIEVF